MTLRTARPTALAAAGLALFVAAVAHAAPVPNPDGTTTDGPTGLSSAQTAQVYGSAPAVLWLLNLTGPAVRKPLPGTLSSGLTGGHVGDRAPETG